jgi:hypothetical protein
MLRFGSILRPMAAWIRARGGRLVYAGRISRRPFDTWAKSREGSAAIGAAASQIRFSLFGRQWAARRRMWRELANAAADESVAAAIQDEADRYLQRLSQLAYAEGLPRVAVNLYRLVVVPRQLLNGVARHCLAARLRRQPALTCLDSDPLREFFSLQLVRDMDAAAAGAQPTLKRPLETGHGWVSVGLNTTYVWFAAVEDSRWAGHHFAFELPPRDGINRAMRKAIADAVKTFEASLPALSRNERNEILRRAWPPELLR